MTLVTTPMSYLAHRKKSFNGDGLRWRINLHRWAWLRLGAFLAGLAIVDALTSVGVPGLGAVIINGVAQAIPYYLISKWWALAEVEGLKA